MSGFAWPIHEYSRKEIIETMRDKEDAHSDDQLAPEYASVSYKGALGITQVNSNDHKFDMNPARVVARQVAHEVLRIFVPDLPPKWTQTRGFKVQPIYLVEIHEQGHDGEYHPVTDHKAVEFKSETTSSPEVWQEWEKFISNGVPNEGSHQDGVVKHQRMRVGIFNYAPFSEQIRAMVSIQDPAG